jgi:NAD(P)H dehydrogenase (quinone)
MSQISARENSKSHPARDHWIAERVFDSSGVPVSHIRPTFFAQWLTYPHNRKQILEHRVISRAVDNGRHALIAAEDQARFIAAFSPIQRRNGQDLSVVWPGEDGSGRHCSRSQ